MIQTDNYSLNEFEDKINGIYNGRECVYNAAKTKIKVKCDYCGKETEKYISQIKNTKSIFCNLKCYGKFKSVNWTGENSPLYIGLTAICLNCGNVFGTEKNILDIDKGKFCNKECFYEYARAHPEKYPRYVGGSTKFNHN